MSFARIYRWRDGRRRRSAWRSWGCRMHAPVEAVGCLVEHVRAWNRDGRKDSWGIARPGEDLGR